MDTTLMTLLVTGITPFITEATKRLVDNLFYFLSNYMERSPTPVRVLLPLLIGAMLQAVGASIADNMDMLSALGLGAMAGGLASSGRDLIHKTRE